MVCLFTSLLAEEIQGTPQFLYLQINAKIAPYTVEYGSEILLRTVLFEETSNFKRWHNEHGEICMRYPGGRVAHIVYKGYLSEQFVDPIVEAAERIVTDLSPAHLFSDIRAITGIAPAMRLIVTRWTWANRHHFQTYNVLLKPGIAGTTMAAISLRLGGFATLWTEPAAFEKALTKKVATHSPVAP